MHAGWSFPDSEYDPEVNRDCFSNYDRKIEFSLVGRYNCNIWNYLVTHQAIQTSVYRIEAKETDTKLENNANLARR